jgi:colanic acid/amylovoran biosynthesis glycosyltransferase
MNILMVTPWYKPIFGGVVSAVERVSKGLIKNGNRVYILVSGDNLNIEQVSRDDAIPVYSCRLRTPMIKITKLKAFVGLILGIPPTLFCLMKFIKLNRIDMIVIHYPGPEHFYFRLLKIIFGVKYAVCVHGHEIEADANDNPAIRLRIKRLISKSEALIACSNYMLEQTRTILGDTPPLSRVIYLGIDPRWTDSVPSTKYELPDNYIVINIAPTKRKGADIALKAFSLLDGYADKTKLILLGNLRPEDEIVTLIEKLGLKDKILSLGSIPGSDVPLIVKGAKFGIVPSRREPFGLVSLEYQLLGKAVIGSRVGGLQETIVDGETGFLVSPEDIDALAKKMDECLKDPALCSKIGENGRRNVMAKFSLEKTATEYSRLFKEILES